MNYWTQSANNVYVAAHRGWSAKYPENTMIAFEKAVEAGVDQIETDIRITKDGELVLIHDSTVDRTTDGTGKVCEYTLEQLQTLDAGSWMGAEFVGTKIPKLTDLMDLVKDHPTMTLDLELKEYPTEGWEEVSYSVCDRVLKIVDDYNFTDRVVINTWNAKLMEYIVGKYGNKYRLHVYYPVYKMGKPYLNPYAYAYCACMFRSVGAGNATPEEYAAMRKSGVRTWAGASVNSKATVEQAVLCGAELITCNNVDLVLAELRAMGCHK